MGIHTLSVGRAGTETLHAKEAANKQEKKRFPPDGCASIRTVRARYNIFHLRRIRTQELVWVKTCMTIHFDPFGFYIRFFLFFFPLVSLLIGCGMHCARSRRSANACQSHREHPAARGPVFAAVINNLLQRQLGGERVGALGCSIGCNQRRVL